MILGGYDLPQKSLTHGLVFRDIPDKRQQNKVDSAIIGEGSIKFLKIPAKY